MAEKIHYVDNKSLTAAMAVWKEEWSAAPEGNKPKLPDSVAEGAYRIATRLASKPSFYRYTYKDDLIGEALLAVALYAHNFDAAKCKVGGAFAYLTQIIHSAFVRTINREGKHTYITALIVNEQTSAAFDNMKETGYEIIAKFETTLKAKREKSKANSSKIRAKKAKPESEDDFLLDLTEDAA